MTMPWIGMTNRPITTLGTRPKRHRSKTSLRLLRRAQRFVSPRLPPTRLLRTQNRKWGRSLLHHRRIRFPWILQRKQKIPMIRKLQRKILPSLSAREGDLHVPSWVKSAPAKAALEKAHQQPQEAPTMLATTAPSNVDTTSASFKPHNIAGETSDAAAAANLESVLQEKEDGEPYLDMFWMDAAERNGDILLFGKVRMEQRFKSSRTFPMLIAALLSRTTFAISLSCPRKRVMASTNQ